MGSSAKIVPRLVLTALVANASVSVMDNIETPPEDRLLRISEVARLAGVTVPTIRNWERLGKIPARRSPTNQRRFRLSEVIAFLEDRH